MQTALAIVVATDAGSVIPGAIGTLESKSGAYQLLVGITNKDGYAVFNNVPIPFDGMVKLTGAVQYYEAPFTVTGQNVTLRVGPTPASPQDVLLPGAIPFV